MTLQEPTAPPPRPPGTVEPRPEDIVFEVERPGGIFKRFRVAEDREVFVMVGNPRITGFEHTRDDGVVAPPFSLKANRMVLWVDRKHFEPMGMLEDVQSSVDAADGGEQRAAAVQSVLEKAVLGIYAEGAVELVFGDLQFRAERLHIEPRTFQALLIEPRFEGLARGQADRGGDLPLHVRARQARLIAKGVAVFDDADVGATRTSDRIELRVKTLTLEELQEGTSEEAGAEEPSLLGFRNLSSQTYAAQGTQLRGERVPLFYWPNQEFGYPDGQSFPVSYKRIIYGNRSTLGRYLLLVFGGSIGNAKNPLFDWTGMIGGYTEKGPAGGLELQWDKPKTYGRLSTWGVLDYDGKDFVGYVPPDTFRWFVNFENRNTLSKNWQIDAEFHDFSDQGVMMEYWENEALTHKPYESYVRPRFEKDTFVSTLLVKWHQRDWVTETTSLPELNVWLASVPLLVPKQRGGAGIDLTSWTRGGYLERYVGEDPWFESDRPWFEPEVDGDRYAAWRFQTDTRLNLAFDLSDVRVSSYAGVWGSSYQGRTDDGEDLTRAALVAGARANLQLNRAWNTKGTFFQLDRLRHVVDLDAEVRGAWFDHNVLAEIPYFDRTDEREQRSEGVLRVRNRVQTRTADGGIRDVLDLELSWHHWVSDIGPEGLRGPGEVDYVLRGQFREQAYVGGEGRFDLHDGTFFRASIGAGARPSDRLSFFTGLRYIRAEATAPFVDVAWRWSEKYGFRLLEQYDFKNGENRTRLVFGRYSGDHAWFFGVSLRGTDDYGFEFEFQPIVGTGGQGRGRMLFNDEPSLDPWEIFR